MKKTTLLLTALFLSVILAGCQKEDSALSQYKSDMTDFTNTVDDLITSIDQIDLESDTRTEELLGYLDEMDAAFAEMSELKVPEQFANVEELADDASANLSESVSLYHQAFDSGEEFDPNILDAALEYYSRALKRLDYIGIILQGDLPEDDTITIIHESEDDNDDEKDTGETESDEEDAVG